MPPLPLAHAADALGGESVLCVSETRTPNTAEGIEPDPQSEGGLVTTGWGRPLLGLDAATGGGSALARFTNTCGDVGTQQAMMAKLHSI
jgi:hypothetical protein